MPIRISDNYLSQVLVGDLNRSLGRLLELQRQAGTMQRVNDFADDPRAVGAIQRYKTLLASNDQYLRNVTRSRSVVDGTDSALQDISGLLAEVRELSLRESSAVATPESRQTAVIQVDNLVNRMLDLLNTSVEGNYIFGGTRTDSPPFVRNGDTVIYQGNQDHMITDTGPHSQQVLNIPGSEFIGAMSSTLAGTADLAPRLTGTTDLDDLNLGSGWQPGRISIRDGNNDTWTVDLTGASTVDDVLTAIDTATGGAVTASIAPDGTGLQLDGTGPIMVGDLDDGTAATSLGINGASEADTFRGRDIRAALADTTALADIAALDGSLPLGTVEIETESGTTTVDFSGAVTVGDLKSTLEGALPGFQLRIDPSGLSIVSGDTTNFEVRNSGTPETASLLGLEGLGTPVRLFGVLEDLRTALENDDPDAVRSVAGELEALEQLVQAQMIKVGGRQQDLDWTETLLQKRDTELQSKLSLERDADVAQVSSDLAAAEMSYQSSLMVTSKLFQQNLMMYL
jgi:flagellar hook-associated protein 3 FlgL